MLLICQDGSAISDLLTDYAMALLRELGIHTDPYDEEEEEGGLDEEGAAVKIQSVRIQLQYSF